MITETVKVADGKLIFTREGKKLIKVKYVAPSVDEVCGDDDLVRCAHCRTWIYLKDNGTFYDLADKFLCFQSPSSMHNIYKITS